MIKSCYYIIGVMSGTSLDGIDLAYMTFEIGDNWSFQFLHTETYAYSEQWKETLSNLINLDEASLETVNKDYTTYLGGVINNFIDKYQCKTIDAICSHGHTALHQPTQKLTYQIGNLPFLSKLIAHTTVCDFRVQDVAYNGEGAPLVPIGDRLLFSEYDFCVNLGGFANISYEWEGTRIAYDICPVNIVMNRFAEQLGFDYDKGGAIAKSGKVNIKLLDFWNSLDYYKQLPPKSLGVEWTEIHIFTVLRDFKISEADILRTFVEHIAIQIAQSFNSNAQVLFTGGGTFNTFLLDRIRAQKQFDLMVPTNQIIEYKEALIFGLLGVLKLRGEVNCLSSVTGADCDHSSGVIYYP